MNRYILGLAGLLVSGVLFSVLLPARAAMPSIVINELLWMGSSASANDEWVELRNTTANPVDLTGWRLTKVSSGTEVTMLMLPAVTIEADGYLLIANDPAATSRLAVEPDVVDPAISLVNSKLQITVYDAANSFVDRADDGSGAPLAGAYENGAVWKSMERNPFGADGTVAASWHTASASQNFDAAIEYGTPRAVNSNQPPEASFTAPETVSVGETAAFDATETKDAEGDPLSYTWSFGDGTTGDGMTPTHRYSVSGSYVVRLTVGDGLLTAMAEHTVLVQSVPVQPETTAPPASSTPTTLILSELFPNPEGSDSEGEFIEVANTGTEEATMAGWVIADSTSRYTAQEGDLPSLLVPAGGFLVFPRSVTGIALNNSGTETVTLLATGGTTVSTASYSGTVAENASFSFFGSVWQWTDRVTRGSANEAGSGKATEGNTMALSPESLQTSADVVINELFPNPVGADEAGEFVEILNRGRETIDLRGWKITTTKREYRIAKSLPLEPGEVVGLLRSETGLVLKNSGEETLFAVDPFNKVIHGVRYGKAPEGKSFSFIDGRWQWTTPTPFEPNIFTDVDDDVAKEKEKDTPGPSLVTIAEALRLPRKSKIQLSGTVITPSDVFGVGVFYVADDDAGIRVVATTSSDIVLHVGDVVTLAGTLGSTDGEPVLRLTNDGLSTAVASGTEPPLQSWAEQLSGGLLAEATGTIREKRGTSFRLETDHGVVPVSGSRLPSGSLATLKNGDTVRVVGLWRVTNDGGKLYPRAERDLAPAAHVLGATIESPATRAPITLSPPSQTKENPWLSMVLPMAVVALGGAVWFWRRRAAAP